MAEDTVQDPISGPTSKDEHDRFDLEFPNLFYVKDMEAVNNVILNYQLKTKSQFSVIRESKHFRSKWSIYDGFPNHRIYWKDREGRYEKVPYDGIPFFVVGKRTMACTFGPTYRSGKGLEKENRDKNGEVIKRRCVSRRSVGCPAQISVREIHKFPSYQISSDSKHIREKMMRQLRDEITKKAIAGERRFYVSLPRMADHKGHDFDKDVSKLRTDCRVAAKLADFVYRRVFDQVELRKRITKYVQEELFKDTSPPPLSDTRFYPSKRRIRNISYNTRIKMIEEGIAVPFLGTGKKSEQIKRAAKPRLSKSKKAKRKNVEVVQEYQTSTAESADAAKMLLMLEKEPRRTANRDLVIIEVEEEPSSSSSSSGDETDNDETDEGEENDKVVTQPTANLYQDVLVQDENETVNSVEINSQDVVELHPEKQACLDRMERMKPLIVFSEDIDKVRKLKNLLDNCIKDMEGDFG